MIYPLNDGSRFLVDLISIPSSSVLVRFYLFSFSASSIFVRLSLLSSSSSSIFVIPSLLSSSSSSIFVGLPYRHLSCLWHAQHSFQEATPLLPLANFHICCVYQESGLFSMNSVTFCSFA